jgi:hypothetical protein
MSFDLESMTSDFTLENISITKEKLKNFNKYLIDKGIHRYIDAKEILKTHFGKTQYLSICLLMQKYRKNPSYEMYSLSESEIEQIKEDTPILQTTGVSELSENSRLALLAEVKEISGGKSRKYKRKSKSKSRKYKRKSRKN